ncbi:MAG: hypothetical protein J5827_01235 [Oscillospiraceae bacterium]|nr:hypothetical protein [Oscillospiraceae bacterium]
MPPSTKKLGDEATRLVDLYLVAQLPEEDLIEAINAWKENVPTLLIKDSGKGPTISPTLVRYIGKKRSNVLATLLFR